MRQPWAKRLLELQILLIFQEYRFTNNVLQWVNRLSDEIKDSSSAEKLLSDSNYYKREDVEALLANSNTRKG